MHRSTLELLINQRRIFNTCLCQTNGTQCNSNLTNESLVLAKRILELPEFQNLSHVHDYHEHLSKLAICSFCPQCKGTHLDQVKQYYTYLVQNLADELERKSEGRPRKLKNGRGTFDAPNRKAAQLGVRFEEDVGETRASEEISSPQMKRRPGILKARHSIHPDELKELADQIKKLEIETSGFKCQISSLKLELETERNTSKQHKEEIAALSFQNQGLKQHRDGLHYQHEELKQEHQQMIAQAETKFSELMQRVVELEEQNAFLQQIIQSPGIATREEIFQMSGAIKELNQGLIQCLGEHYALRLSLKSQAVVNVLG